MSLPGAVVIGVGAEQRLGAALCRHFAAEGYHVLVTGQTSDKIDKIAHAIAAAGGRDEPIVTDATSEANAARLFDRAITARDGISPADLVVYNAGKNQRIDFRELTAA